jgi:hypothetical protein
VKNPRTDKAGLERNIGRKFWWWRRANRDFTFDPTYSTTELKKTARNDHWKRAGEIAAHHYELLRRHADAHGLKPFDNLPREEKTFLEELFGSEVYPTIRSPDDGVMEIPQRPGASRDDTDWSDPIQLRLTARDGAIAVAIMRYVEHERKKQRIARPKREGTRFRSVSWRGIELLDLEKFGATDLSDNEKRTLRRAKVEAAKLYDRYQQALEWEARHTT